MLFRSLVSKMENGNVMTLKGLQSPQASFWVWARSIPADEKWGREEKAPGPLY